MERSEALTIRPLGTDYLVEMVKPAEKTAGGIYLPDSARENWQDAQVLRRGPGLGTGGLQVFTGERVVFLQHQFRPLVSGSRFGMIADEALIAIVADGDILPLNNWVQIELEEFEKSTAGGVLIPQENQRRLNRGTVLDYGDGVLSRSWRNYGQRRAVRSIMNLADDCPLIGQRAWWGSAQEAYEIGSESVQAVLVKADDLLFLEEC